ncbi:MAG: SurA N-terminal domain-containing protein [Ardenticatenaceae bacterium]|nr:SurA N-terminal domain-containing protein [Ardenticatenaceae bacterium]MCB9443144.1 SurA N-terminal domain-containing protein [Ardenticatenaceae bacterium]
MKRIYTIVASLLLIGLLGVACNGQEKPATVSEAAVTLPTTAPTAVINPTPPTPTAIPPTPTPTEPMAALVNDRPVFLARYQQELARYEQAQAEMASTPGADGTDYRALVLDTLIEKELIAQAAAQRGIIVTDEAVTAKLAELENSTGESGNFDAWLSANLYTREQFKEALAEEMLTEAVVADVTASVPTTAEQVKARYLQVNDLALAESLLQQILSGADFGTLANQYSLDRITAENGGDLGDYFPRGSLLIPIVEEAAFALQIGEVSQVITDTGADGVPTYYLVQTLERDGERPLTANMRYTMLQQAFEMWLNDLWQSANITRLIES